MHAEVVAQQMAKRLVEPLDVPLHEGVDGLAGGVARAEARAAGEDQHVCLVVVGDAGDEQLHDLRLAVDDDVRTKVKPAARITSAAIFPISSMARERRSATHPVTTRIACFFGSIAAHHSDLADSSPWP